MKKLGFILVSVLLLTGCKTKQVTVAKERENHFVDVNEMVESREKTEVSKQTTSFANEVRELSELLQNLNVTYAGEDVNDKLDLLLSKTDQGTKLTISGKGTANYNESNRQELESLRKELLTRQDSLHDVELRHLQDLQAKIDSYIRTKDKDVKTKTFTPVVWLIIGLAVVLGMFLNWLSKLFKPR